ncbi:MAG: ABC transporter substrate-binding protein [Nitrospinae bacterium]|nr:ABC transporter substrate-binding protein [Nitrospinota bacterium]
MASSKRVFVSALLAAVFFAGTAGASNKGVTIGCVLPLSGDQAEAGAQALKGIQLAFSAKSRFVDKAGLKLVLKDSGGGGDSMAEAMRELSADETVLAVVGMFTQANVGRALAASADGLAIIAPSAGAKQTVGQNGKRRIHWIEATDSGQAGLLAETAIKNLGLSRFAVLRPDDQYGAEMARLFAEAVKKNGGTVGVVEKFEAAQTDFRAQMTALGGMDDQHLRGAIFTYAKEHPEKSVDDLNDALRLTYGKGRSYPRITKTKGMPLTKNNFSFEMKVGYDALFLPAGYEQAGLILPALSFYNIADLVVLGTDRMLSPELVTIGGKYAENVLFTGEFYPTMSGEAARTFVDDFRNAVGDPPDAAAARYYDAMMITLTVAEGGGAGERKKMLDALDNLATYVGVTGTVTRGPDGNLEKSSLLFTVEGGKITEYEPPPPAPSQQ